MRTKLIDFFAKEKRNTRIGVHLVVWGIVWLFTRYYLVPSLIKDNEVVDAYASLQLFCQTVVLYYWLGHYVFPTYLYTRKIGRLLLLLLLTFEGIHVTNYYTFFLLAPLSNGVSDLVSTYMERAWILYNKPNGLIDWLFNLDIAFINFGWTSFWVSLMLLVKVVKDIIVSQARTLRLETQNIVLERDNLALELNFLKSQINPHFLFNTLNSIYTRTVDVDEQAAELVLKLSDLMRYSLYESNVEAIALANELEYIQNYLDLEQARHSKQQADITFSVEGDVDRYQIAPLLLVSFIENAFKHGVMLSRQQAYVHITVCLIGDKLLFTSRNSLPPKRVNSLPLNTGANVSKSGGIGLVNVNKRLELLYPNRHKLSISQTDAYYKVELSLQLDPIPSPV